VKLARPIHLALGVNVCPTTKSGSGLAGSSGNCDQNDPINRLQDLSMLAAGSHLQMVELNIPQQLSEVNIRVVFLFVIVSVPLSGS